MTHQNLTAGNCFSNLKNEKDIWGYLVAACDIPEDKLTT